MNKNDRTALELALQHCRAQSADRARQIDAMLADQPWFEVATFASYSAQRRALHLKLWQDPPCQIDLDNPDANIGGNDFAGHRAAVRLLRRMLDLGISRFHPDPMQAIAADK